MRRLRRFVSLSPSEQQLLLRAAFLAGSIRVGLWLLPFRIVQRFAFGAKAKRNTNLPVDQVVWAVRAVSRCNPGATCLTQALTAQALLIQSGHQSHVEIGVTKSDDSRFEAHAWVIFGDRVLIGGPEVDRYTPLVAWKEGL
jgi:hypothetical protein